MSTERDHCIEVANTVGECAHSPGNVKLGYWEFVAIILRERADAREKALAELRANVRKALGEGAT